MVDKIFIKGIYGKVINTQYGEIGKVSIHIEKFGEAAKAHVNDKGYINIDILKSQKKDELGNDIWYTALDTYKKDSQNAGGQKSDKPFGDVDNTPTGSERMNNKPETLFNPPPPVEDDLPF